MEYKNKVYRSRSPVRITFGGGGTDISPYDKDKGGFCLSAAINKYAYCTLKIKGDSSEKEIKIHSGDFNQEKYYPSLDDINYDGELDLLKAVVRRMNPQFGFELYVRSDIYPHSGLGSSSAVSVAAIALFNNFRKKDRLTDHQIAELAFKIEEEEIGNVGGRQDQYAITFGGINLFEFYGGDNVRINPTKARRDHILELEKNLLIVSTGKRVKPSGQIQRELKQQNLYFSEDKIMQLDMIKEIALEMDYCLREGNLKRFGELIKESWKHKKSFNPQASNPHIDDLIETAYSNGAIGCRLMGAGGGGHLLIYCESNKEQSIAEELKKKGGEVRDFTFDFEGYQVWEAEE